MAIDDEKNERIKSKHPRGKVRIKLYGEEMIEKTVNYSGKNGRIYLPIDWVGKKVKVVKCYN